MSYDAALTAKLRQAVMAFRRAREEDVGLDGTCCSSTYIIL